MNSPLVSIIIPTFNREKELERAVSSVFKQTYINWEICVVDNFSSDNSVQLINNYNDPRVKLYMIQNEGIIGASRNLGIQKANGKYLAFLDSDDWWSPYKLEESIKFLENCETDIIYHDLHIVNKENQKFFFKKTKSRQLLKPIFNDLIINGNTLVTSSVVMRKDILSEISGFTEDNSLIAIEDYDAWLSLAIKGQKFFKISKTLGFYWVGGKNTSNPERTLKTIDELERKYQRKISELELSHQTYWFNYSKARAYSKINMRDKALLEFKSSLDKKPIFKIKLKIWICIYILKIQIFFN